MPEAYELIYRSVELVIDKEGKGPARLYFKFEYGEGEKKASFREPLFKLLDPKPKSLTAELEEAIRETAPKKGERINIRISRKQKVTTYSVHPNYLEKWAKKIMTYPEEKKQKQPVS